MSNFKALDKAFPMKIKSLCVIFTASHQEQIGFPKLFFSFSQVVQFIPGRLCRCVHKHAFFLSFFFAFPTESSLGQTSIKYAREVVSFKNFLLFVPQLLIRNYFLFSPNTFTLDYRSSSENLRPRGESFENMAGAENGFPEIPAGLINGFCQCSCCNTPTDFFQSYQVISFVCCKFCICFLC